MRKLGIAAVTVGALLVLGALRAADLWAWRSQILRTAEVRSDNLAHILTEYIRESFAASDTSLRQLAVHSRRIGGPLAPDAAWLPSLTAARAGLRDVGSLSVVDREGVIRHSTQPLIVGQPRSGQYVFRRLSTMTADELVVDTPFPILNDPKTFLIPVGRRLVNEAGEFDGIVVAMFSPAAPRGLFRTVDVGERGVIWVFHPDGQVLFREPSETNPIGEPAAGNPIFKAAIRRDGVGRVEGPLTPGGPMFLSAFQVSTAPPLVVAVSLERDEVLADWWRQARTLVAISGVVGVTTIAVLIVAFHQMDTRARTLAAALDAEQRARRTSEEASRLKEEFLMTVSHELRTPLQSILGWARVLLSNDRPNPQSLRNALETIERNAGMQARLIDDLLDVSRAVSGKLQLEVRPTDLAEVIRHVVQTSRPAAEAKGIRISVELDDLPLIPGDPDRLQQVVWNLLNNAVKFTPEGGRVDVRLARHGSKVDIVVRDSGIGIEREFLPFVFDRFRQADSSTTRRHGGLGLGLAIVRHLTELHGGVVTVESDGRDRGATFRVQLPAVVSTSMIERAFSDAAIDTRVD